MTKWRALTKAQFLDLVGPDKNVEADRVLFHDLMVGPHLTYSFHGETAVRSEENWIIRWLLAHSLMHGISGMTTNTHNHGSDLQRSTSHPHDETLDGDEVVDAGKSCYDGMLPFTLIY